MMLLIMSFLIPLFISNLAPPKIHHNVALANGSKAQDTGIGQVSDRI